MNGNQPPAIRVRGAYKTYDGRSYVLRGLNMTVSQGTIYGLLGPSGCGKSTLLNAIVGLVGLEAGEISTSMETKSDLGFMPQQMALYERMNTFETLSYYGNIAGMSDEEIKKRSDYLIKFLEIPTAVKDNISLSGGQRRRLSLAAALINNPPVIVLDEPTVGVDPLLRQSIWSYLIHLTEKENKTVVITTHYIEETSQAHKIGLMRSGVLISEDTPKNLLSQNNSRSLEETFMRLSHLQECDKLHDEKTDEVIRHNTYEKPSKPAFTEKSKSFKSKRFKAEIMKNFLFVKRDFIVILFTVLVPITTILCAHFAEHGEPSPYRLGVVNEEFPSGSNACERWQLPKNESCDFANLSCRFLKNLETKQIFPVELASKEQGLIMVRRAEIWGIIRFPRNYSEALERRTALQPINDNPDKDKIIDSSTVDVWLDESNVIIDYLLKLHLYDVILDTLADVYNKCGWPLRVVQLPIKMEPVYLSQRLDTFELDPRDSVLPVMIIVLMFTMPMLYGIAVFMEERLCGACARSIVAGVTPFEMMISHLVVQMIIHTLQMASASLMMYGFLGYDIRNIPITLTLVFTQGFPGIAFSFFLPLVVNSLIAVGIICTGFVFLCVTVSGAIWPVEGFHPLLRSLIWLNPMRYSSTATFHSSYKGWGLEEPTILYGFGSLLSWTVIFVIAIYLAIVLSKNRVFLGKNA
ncbi:ATP-Hypothetical protein cassette sub-family A ABC1 member [Nesidiocoris tenuis]|nr:ATP-Hypothetical protein cassette sub-family A ABC1 member [Nesidiocoris tenuis]